MNRLYCIAGICFEVCLSEDVLLVDGILSDYVCVNQKADVVLDFNVVDELSEPVGTCLFDDSAKKVYSFEDNLISYYGSTMRVFACGSVNHVEVKASSIPNGITSRLVVKAMDLEHLLVQKSGVLFHSTYVRVGDEAILFTAPSGTGKSTQADLWVKHRGAELLNGDRSCIMIEDGHVVVHGVPYSGSSDVHLNRSLPLKAIVYLAQAPKTTITRLTGAKAFRAIWEGCSFPLWNKTDVELCTETVSVLAGHVPVYYMPCTPDESAVVALESVLGE